MRRKYRYIAAAAGIMAAMLLMTGCGCGKKNTDPETQEVLKISITPEPTPTETPQETNPDAVVTKDGITMVNSYTKDGTPAAAVSVTPAADAAADTAETDETLTDESSTDDSSEDAVYEESADDSGEALDMQEIDAEE